MNELIPPIISNRKDKKGFDIPESDWMRNELAEPIGKLFSSNMLIANLGIIDQDLLIAQYKQYVNKGTDFGDKVFFRAVALEKYLRSCSNHIKP